MWCYIKIFFALLPFTIVEFINLLYSNLKLINMKKPIICGLLIAVCVAFAAPVNAQLAKRKDLSIEDIRTELNNMLRQDDAASKAQLAKEALALSKSNNEEHQILAVSLYRNLGDTKTADKINEGIVKKFPKGIRARSVAMNAIFENKETSALEKEAAYHAWLKKFPSNTFNVNNQSLYSQAAMMLGRELVNDGQYDRLGSLISGTEDGSAINYNLISTISSELIKKEEYGQALPHLERAFEGIEKEENQLAVHRSIIGQYANALIGSGQAEKGVTLLKDLASKNPGAAATVSNTISLAQGYAKMGRAMDAYLMLENHLLTRSVSGQIFAEMETLYQTLNNDNGDFAAVKENLDKKVLAALKEKYKSAMIKQEAPSFRLRNMKGDFVSLEDMRGKIVVLDFWATWCGPCIVSFPGMQTALNKYENDPDVAFLFIDTWQSEENYEELVTNFIAENGYSFHVLYDEMKDRPKATVTAYGVQGIPTKVFIDKDGFIRFQSAGGSPDIEMVMTEVVAKIELIRDIQGE